MINKWTLDTSENEAELYDDIHPLIQSILIQKGIREIKDMVEFLSDKPKKTYDPCLMKNMDESVGIILNAVRHKRNIWIYGDYDVDGLTSVGLLTEVLSCLTERVFYYIPSRMEEGYGLNREALDMIKNRGADLVITVDCGAVSIDEVQYAKEIGLDIIITDHHNVGEVLPDCLMINPKQKDCRYPYKDLCGCGVAFKLAQMIQRKAGLDRKILNRILDLVAIATVSDIVPLTDENRVLVKYGLKEINKRRRKGLSVLLESVGLKYKEVNAYYIAFIIGPHLNAGGRMDTAETGVKLFLSNDEKEARNLARLLVELNRERKNIQDEGYRKCIDAVNQNYSEDLFIVIDSEDIHEGVAGIIAGKIKDKYHRPSIIVTESREEGILKGTGRSIAHIDIHQILKMYDYLFLKFGGHSCACGFSMKPDKLDLLRTSLNKELKKMKESNPEYFENEIKINLELKITDLTLDFIKILKQLEPFGFKNEKPIFLLKGLTIQDEYFMGGEREHLKLVCYDGSGNCLEAVAFNRAEEYKGMEKISEIDLVGYPEINEYNGTRKIQFLIKDFRKAEGELIYNAGL